MYKRLLRSVLAVAFSAAVALGALSGAGLGATSAGPPDSGWGSAPVDSGWGSAPVDSGWGSVQAAPPDSGWGSAPVDSGWGSLPATSASTDA